MPDISIIILNWNGKHFLETCLTALRWQTFRDFETILVDNGSDDGSAESPDIVGSFALFAILCPSVSGLRLRRVSVVLLVIVLLASGLLAYSRYIWLLEGFAVVVAMIIERKFKLLAAVTLAAILFASMSYETLQPVIKGRFFSSQTTDSDLTRVEQSQGLVNEIKTRPLFGKDSAPM